MKFDPLLENVREYPVDRSRVLDGDPRPSSALLWGSPGDKAWGGIWEMSEGTLGDVDEDEIAYVLCGRATLTFADTGESVELEAGDLFVLTRGRTSTMQVHERFRAIFATHH